MFLLLASSILGFIALAIGTLTLFFETGDGKVAIGIIGALLSVFFLWLSIGTFQEYRKIEKSVTIAEKAVP